MAHGAANFLAEAHGEHTGALDQDVGLHLRPGQDDDGLIRDGQLPVEGFEGYGCGFAPLAVAAEDEIAGVAVHDLGLFGAGDEIEQLFGPFGGF